MLIGGPPNKYEQAYQHWLQNSLFSFGLENRDCDFQYIKEISSFIITSNTEQLIEIIGKLNVEVQKYMRVALKLCDLIIVEDESALNDDAICHVIIEQFFVKYWDTFEQFDEPIFDVIIRIFLVVLLKHTGLLNKVTNSNFLQEIYVYIMQLTRRLLSFRKTIVYNSIASLRRDSQGNEKDSGVLETSEIDLDYEIKDYNNTSTTKVVENTEETFEYLCSVTLKRCLYLLLCVKGPVSFSVDESSAFSDDENEEKHYVEFYQSSCDNSKRFKHLREICKNAVNFVCDDSILSEISNNKHEDDLELLQSAMQKHTQRAEIRLNSLTQIYDLLSCSQKHRSSTTLISCTHQQLLSGCFGLINLKLMESCTQLHHYTEGIQAASFNLQNKIKEIVHNIYSVLISSLKDNPKLQILIIFSLSTRYKPDDLKLVIKNDLLKILVDISKSQTSYVIPNNTINNEISPQAIASLRLLNIIAMSCSLYTSQLDSSVIEQLMNTLREQLTGILQIISNKESPQRTNIKILNYERNLGDFLVFIRCIASNKLIRYSLCSKKWTQSLLSISGNQESINFQSLRPKLLSLQLLGTVLPAVKSTEIDLEDRELIIKDIFAQLAKDMWNIPNLIAEKKAKEKQAALHQTLFKLINSTDSVTSEILEEELPIPFIGFDPDKTLCCTVDNSLTLVHGVGGTGYGLGNKMITSGCYQWRFFIVKEGIGNEGTCVGISKYPITDCRHRTTSDMWLYRAYSGGLYHNGEKDLCLQRFTHGDFITVVLDMDSKTLSFGKNGEEPRVAFEDIDATEVYPCVLFYGSGVGEKVKMTDMQVWFLF